MMKYNKFIILYTSNFCERVSDFFCVKEWIESGYDIEYWDLSQFTCHETLKAVQIEGLIINEILNIKDFERHVKSLNSQNTLFLTWVNYCWYSAGFYEVISKYKFDYAFFDNGLIPSLTTSIVKKNKSIMQVLRGIRNRYYLYRAKTHVLKPASYYFRLSEVHDGGADKIDHNTIIGWCNSGDYEHNSRLKPSGNKDFVVFLDQYIPYHNDNTLNGQKQIDPERYYCSVNRFFEYVENRYGVPVVIAAHPAAMRYNTDNPYNGRKICFNLTSELVHDCKFVLSHFTTAISFVVLNNKKMISLTSDVFVNERPWMDKYIQRISDVLGVPYVNIDHLKNIDIDDISIETYEKYKYTYLTNKYSESQSNFKSILQTLNN